MLQSVLGNSDLSFWPSAALVIFFVTFVGIVFRTFRRSRKEMFEAAARIPLNDEERESHER